MSLTWKQYNETSWVGKGGKYLYHIKEMQRNFTSNTIYGIARGNETEEKWFNFTLTMNEAKILAEQDVIENIMKEDENRYTI